MANFPVHYWSHYADHFYRPEQLKDLEAVETLENRKRNERMGATGRLMAGLAIAACGLGVTGCGSSVERQHLRGTVTYKGQPLAAGQIRFSPVKREGLGGAFGGAQIKDGQYDTQKNGLPAPVGEVQVLVTAIRQAETDTSTTPSFPGYSTTYIVQSGTETFDVQVP